MIHESNEIINLNGIILSKIISVRLTQLLRITVNTLFSYIFEDIKSFLVKGVNMLILEVIFYL